MFCRHRSKSLPILVHPKDHVLTGCYSCWHHFEGQKVERRMDDHGNDKDVQVIGL